MTIEVGSRGFVAHSVSKCRKQIGFAPSTISKTCKALSAISARCSYAIYLSYKSNTWDRNRALLELNIPPDAKVA